MNKEDITDEMVKDAMKKMGITEEDLEKIIDELDAAENNMDEKEFMLQKPRDGEFRFSYKPRDFHKLTKRKQDILHKEIMMVLEPFFKDFDLAERRAAESEIPPKSQLN